MSTTKKIIVALLLLAAVVGFAFYYYIENSFPEVRCEGKHLTVPEKYADCVSCHIESTPKITQDWYESKHGVMLVKCAVCHGDPAGNGAIPFAVNPNPIDICGRCHGPSIARMQEKYGIKADCNSCHPYHQNGVHRDAYEGRIPTTKTTF